MKPDDAAMAPVALKSARQRSVRAGMIFVVSMSNAEKPVLRSSPFPSKCVALVKRVSQAADSPHLTCLLAGYMSIHPSPAESRPAFRNGSRTRSRHWADKPVFAPACFEERRQGRRRGSRGTLWVWRLYGPLPHHQH